MENNFYEKMDGQINRELEEKLGKWFAARRESKEATAKAVLRTLVEQYAEARILLMIGEELDHATKDMTLDDFPDEETKEAYIQCIASRSQIDHIADALEQQISANFGVDIKALFDKATAESKSELRNEVWNNKESEDTDDGKN